MPCLDDAAIDALAQGQLAPEDEVVSLSHLSRCDDCSARVAATLERLIGARTPANLTTQERRPDEGAGSSFTSGALIRERYRVVRRLGAGGAGEVFEVSHLHLPTRLALKVLHPNKLLTTTAMLRFRREARVLAELNHPNIVRVVDFDFVGGRPFFVMEFVDGRELGSLIESGRRVPPNVAFSIIRQLCAALSEVHGRGIIHRDLKPQNILVTGSSADEPVVKIVDFGLSRVRQRQTILTASQAVVGTPLYMSPEQAEGRNDDIDVHTDQFSLGAICYELLSGRAAFQADSVATTIHKVVNVDPPPISPDGGPIPARVEAVIRRALSKRAARRYPSVDEFWRAFSTAWSEWQGSDDTKRGSPDRRRRWIVGGLVASAGFAFVLARLFVAKAPFFVATASMPNKDAAAVADVTPASAVTPVDAPSAAPDIRSAGGADAAGTAVPLRHPPQRRKVPKLFDHL